MARTVIPPLQPAAGVLSMWIQPTQVPARLRDVIVTNVGAAPTKFRIFQTKGNLVASTIYAWIYDLPLAPGGVFTYEAPNEDTGRALAVGDSLVVSSDTGNAVFSGSYIA